MKKCWETKPKDRPTFSELVASLESLLDGRESGTEGVKTKNIENRGSFILSYPVLDIHPN